MRYRVSDTSHWVQGGFRVFFFQRHLRKDRRIFIRFHGYSRGFVEGFRVSSVLLGVRGVSGVFGRHLRKFWRFISVFLEISEGSGALQGDLMGLLTVFDNTS